MRKYFLMGLILLLSVSLLAGCGGQGDKDQSGASGKVTLRVGHVLSPEHSYQLGLEKFAELVAEKTGGTVEVQIFPSSQLGNERDLVEGMQLGTVEMGLISTGPISGFVPEVMLFDLPYIFESTEHAEKVLDGEVGQLIDKKLLDAGIRNLAWWEQGFRSVYNNTRPIEKPEDMNGIKIRVMENPLMVDTFNIMGGNATPMAWGEVFTALQQGTIDGAEGAAETAYTGGFGDVTKYGSLTKQFYSAVPLLIAEPVFQKLSPEQQKAVQAAAVEARDYERRIIREREKEFIQKLKDAGVTFNEPDLAPFRQAVQPLYDKYAGEVGGKELIQKVQDAAK
ncbi:TRAP transporter substrate-binding protein [Desulfoscipio geothermicus]|uniref:Tripartite ATP-independent transporter solute receptor, DctP family n=1 Tax=Desulfoscipio geothermicus DSM 3669 TaxID=1121426 RepID=A0A1I6DWI1_9FIRM|nr:TRAP transporter substrate-binding protein [Desulfoscipio geothermicus]SFR09682.1 tripartite ATP-independent transporter solute receptor, DctP family [Desulfoscipio geothermicus DSM 3669]